MRLKCKVCGSRDFVYRKGVLGLNSDDVISIIVKLPEVEESCGHDIQECLLSDYAYFMWHYKIKFTKLEKELILEGNASRKLTEAELVEYRVKRRFPECD